MNTKTCKTAGFMQPLEHIGSEAYEGNTELREVAFFAPIGEIGYRAFSGCVKLEKVDLVPTGAEKIGDGAFKNCTGLRHVYFPEELKYIGDRAFSGCENLEEIVFPEGINHIGSNAFANCAKLKRVVLPPSLKFVGNYAFSGCNGIEYVELNANVTSRRPVSCGSGFIEEDGIFRDCKNITEVVVGSKVTRLPWNCFNGCTSLRSVQLNNDNVSFLTNTFAGVPYFKGKVRYMDRVLVNAFGLEDDYTIENGTSEIADGAFCGCNLKSVIIPETVRKIGYYAFQGYKGRGITVPPYTTTVMKTAFARFDDVLMPERVLPHSRQNDDAVKYRNADYRLLMDTIAKCEEIAASDNPDATEFLKAFDRGKNVVFYNLNKDWRLIYLTRIRGAGNILAADMFFTVDDGWFEEFLELVILYGLTMKNDKKNKHFIYAFAEKVIADPRFRNEEFGNRRVKLARRLLANDVHAIKYRRKPTTRGGEWPLLPDLLAAGEEKKYRAYHFEVCRVVNAMKCVKHVKVNRWNPQIDMELMAAIDGDSLSQFCLRWDLLGSDDEVVIGYAMDKHAKRILMELYKRLGWLRERLPLNKLIPHICMAWYPGDAVEMIGMLCREYPDECRGIKDSMGADCLWYSLYNAELHGRLGGWKKDNELERVLRQIGYDGKSVNSFGLSYDEMVDGWESVEEVESKGRGKTAIIPPPSPVKCRNRQPRVKQSFGGLTVVPQASVVRELPMTGARTPCPEGFKNAMDIADDKGVIEAWKFNGNPEIIRLWIPQEVTRIGNFAFKGCPNLEEVVCEDCGGGRALSLGLMSFAGCGKLKKVSLPVRIGSLGAGAFRDNPGLVDFIVAAGHYPLVVPAHVFDNCPGKDEKFELLKEFR